LNVKLAITRVVGIAAIILIIVAGLFGYSVGYLHQATPKVVTTTETHVQNYTVTQVSLISSANSLPQETITELIIEENGTQGGEGYCQGSSLSSCVGFSIINFTSENTTSYIFPSYSGSYFNATVTTITSSGTIACTDATTRSTTETENSTYIFIEYTWSASCSS
jgi:hypothetical protein